MASITATAPDTRTATGKRRLTAVRRALAPRVAKAAKMASAARHRYRRPALTISAFGCLDAAAWTTFGLGAGLLTLGALLLVLEWLGGDS